MALSEKFTVTVGIPAHNEEQNIKQLLTSIVSQKGNFVLEKILVTTDGCTDQTEEIVRTFSRTHEQVQLLSDGKRIGKAQRINQLYQNSQSDILITLDADILIEGDECISNILKLFENPAIVVVAGNNRPMPGRTLFEKAVAAKDEMWYEARKDFRGGDNIYNSTSMCYALKKEFTKNFRFLPGTANDHQIIYLAVKKYHHGFAFADQAIVRFRDADTWKELVTRQSRFEHQDNLDDYNFDFDIKKEYYIPLVKKIKGAVKILRSSPIHGLIALLLIAALKIWPEKIQKDPLLSSGLWQVSKSTKKIS